MNKLPKKLHIIQSIIEDNYEKLIHFTKIDNRDGRIMSAVLENNILEELSTNPLTKKCIKIPKKRSWYDILCFDEEFNWFPINIKITTTKTSDNVGNLTIPLYSLTNYELDFDVSYCNGKIHSILSDKLRMKEYNKDYKKDYFFLVINKEKKEVIINSVKGLNKLNKNVHNLPFQINWSKNKEYVEKPIEKSVEQFVNLFKKVDDWKKSFIEEMSSLTLTDVCES